MSLISSQPRCKRYGFFLRIMSATLTARPLSPLPNLAAAAFALVGVFAFCQVLVAQQQSGRPDKKQKPAAELIKKQKPPVVKPGVLDQATHDNLSIYISLRDQRAYLKVKVGDREDIGINTPVSTGKNAGMTPNGRFMIVFKEENHRSSLYGAFVDKNDIIVRAGVSTKIDSAPSGTHFKGASMKWFMRFGETQSSQRAEGMHTGILPGYPASHGCVRLPEQIAKLMYEKVAVGTRVTIGE